MALAGDRASAAIESPEPEQVQPAGVDLRLDEVYEFLGPGTLTRQGKELPPVRPVRQSRPEVYELGSGAYRIRFLDVVSVPPDAVGMCFPRSTLLRMGVLLHCAVWDPGYRGRGEALMVVVNPHGARIERGARVAQLVLIRLESRPPKLYSGSYQGEGL